MLARALATESKVPFIHASGSEFIELYVGKGALNVRNLFAQARQKAPCILFIDELDAVGSSRTGESSPGSKEHDQTLNQLLIELDGFEASSNVIVLAATNAMSKLDKALIRPGRFDRVVTVHLPDFAGRLKILDICLAKVRFNGSESDMNSTAKATIGFSGADLANMVNEAAICAAREGKQYVSRQDLEEARNKVLRGPQLKYRIIPESDRRKTAYHEAGHAVVAFSLYPAIDPICQATIGPRGETLGFVEMLPEEDRYGVTRHELEASLVVAMGGRMAEELIYGKSGVTSGASNDIYKATLIATRMVSDYGMSESIGNLQITALNRDKPFGSTSGTVSNLVETEVRSLLQNATTTASTILSQNRDKLDRLVDALMEKETLTGEEVRSILAPEEAKEEKVKEEIVASTLELSAVRHDDEILHSQELASSRKNRFGRLFRRKCDDAGVNNSREIV